MRQDKTVARILLMFSIANVVLAAPVLVRQRRLVTDRTDVEPMGEPEQDPAGPVHPATPPPPAGPDTSSEIWSAGKISEENSAPNSPGLHQMLPPPQPSELENSWLQDPSQDRPNQYEGSLHSPPITLTASDSSHEMLPPALEDRPLQIHPALPATSENHPLLNYPETLEAHPFDDDLWYDQLLSSVKVIPDVDQASTMPWPEWEEDAAKVADETHLHP